MAKTAATTPAKKEEEQPTAPAAVTETIPEEQPTAPAAPGDPNHSTVKPIRGAEVNELPARTSEPVRVEMPNGTVKVTY